jgi:hypothetical protein
MVLEVRGDRLEVYTERGEHASIHASNALPADRASCITPTGPEKLGRAIDDHLRRLGVKKYFRAMRVGARISSAPGPIASGRRTGPIDYVRLQ